MTQHPALRTQHRSWRTQHPALCTLHGGLNTQHPTPSTQHPARKAQSCAHDTDVTGWSHDVKIRQKICDRCESHSRVVTTRGRRVDFPCRDVMHTRSTREGRHGSSTRNQISILKEINKNISKIRDTKFYILCACTRGAVSTLGHTRDTCGIKYHVKLKSSMLHEILLKKSHEACDGHTRGTHGTRYKSGNTRK